jgi:hypothetical protein
MNGPGLWLDCYSHQEILAFLDGVCGIARCGGVGLVGICHADWLQHHEGQKRRIGACRATVLDVKNMGQRSGYLHSAMEYHV